MKAETDQFAIDRVEWLPRTTTEAGAAPPARRDILARLVCKHCFATWKAGSGPGPGEMEVGPESLLIVCPGCGAEGVIPLDILG